MKLQRGTLVRKKCGSTAQSFIPYDLETFPQMVLITAGYHNHPPPRRTKTPPLYVDILNSLLLGLDWRLADATPRNLVTQEGFITRLRTLLEWKDNEQRNPILADLHPSFVNNDHVGYYIHKLCLHSFPGGTDMEGARRLKARQDALFEENGDAGRQYIRSIKSFPAVGDDPAYQLVVCMFPEQSELLLRAKWPVCDTAFKRVKNWKEFDIEMWDDDTNRCKYFHHPLVMAANLVCSYVRGPGVRDIRMR